MTPDLLQNDNICLRAVELNDVDMLYRWENDTSQWATANTHAPYSRTQLWNYANDYDGNIYAGHGIRLMVCLRPTGKAIGTIDIYDFDPANNHATIGVYIASTERGKGYGLQALQLAGRYASQCVGIRQLIAIVAAGNTASRSMLTSAGYRQCGTLREWLRRGDGQYDDAFIFQLGIAENTTGE